MKQKELYCTYFLQIALFARPLSAKGTSMNKIILRSALLASTILAFSCAPKKVQPPTCQPSQPPATPMPGNPINADVTVIVWKDNAGTYQYTYCGYIPDTSGNMNFSTGPAKGHPVRIDITIDDRTGDDAKFQTPGDNAMWVGPLDPGNPTASPAGPYPVTGPTAQFTGFATTANRMSVSVTDKNNDGKDYRYALRFEIDGALEQDDPDIKNDGQNVDMMPADEGPE
jgi:hypothetical protein